MFTFKNETSAEADERKAKDSRVEEQKLVEQRMAMLCTMVADMLHSPHPRHQRVRPLSGDARQLDAHPAL